MAFIFDTDSGSTYRVENGRISRDNWDGTNENGVSNFDRRLARLVQPVKIGERATIRFRDAREGEPELLTTSRVVGVFQCRSASDPITPRRVEEIAGMWANLR
jgi:hypothetical protein